jgi:hypothetical protein
LWSSRRLRLPGSNIRQFAPKCHLVDGLPVCPRQQAFDAFTAAPGGTSSVSRGVFFRMEGAHRVIVSTPGSPLDEMNAGTTGIARGVVTPWGSINPVLVFNFPA